MSESNKKATVTDEHREEARALRAIWEQAKPASQKEFGREFGIGGQAAVSAFLAGKSALSLKAATGFATGLACRIEDFSPRLAASASQVAEVTGAQGEESARPPATEMREPKVPAGYVRLPVLAEAAAGAGRAPLPEVVKYVDVLESFIRQRFNRNPHSLKVLTARGNSMTGDIEDGDVMFVQPTNEFTDDGIYVLTLDDLIRVKRLSVSLISGHVVIESNDGRKPEELPLREVPHRLHIQGRVIGAWSLRTF
ncbi:S24 family peptidase [Alicycliphilus denitrificans]|uniref:S24 family peptidase n=1 Tax=Alicycliphilus denitrificans TaxID=179636 RepID=UPI0015E064B2|nr:S24 family peptidase [Alicycliphilus denitrificans]